MEDSDAETVCWSLHILFSFFSPYKTCQEKPALTKYRFDNTFLNLIPVYWTSEGLIFMVDSCSCRVSSLIVSVVQEGKKRQRLNPNVRTWLLSQTLGLCGLVAACEC